MSIDTPGEQSDGGQDVAAIITAMTDGEQPFLAKTVKAALSDPGIGQVVLCVEEKNSWLDAAIGSCRQDPRLKVVRLPIMPQGAVRNKALDYVQKPWVAYCDGDDVWCKGKTLIQRDFADKTRSDFVGVDHYLIDEEGNVRAFALARSIPMPSAWMVRAEIMRKYPFDESFECRGIEDGEWWIRTANVIRKARCPKVLLRYRVRSGSSSSFTPSKKRKAKIVAFSKIPIVGLSVLFFTYLLRLFTCKTRYIWLPSWGPPPCSPKE